MSGLYDWLTDIPFSDIVRYIHHEWLGYRVFVWNVEDWAGVTHT